MTTKTERRTFAPDHRIDHPIPVTARQFEKAVESARKYGVVQAEIITPMYLVEEAREDAVTAEDRRQVTRRKNCMCLYGHVAHVKGASLKALRSEDVGPLGDVYMFANPDSDDRDEAYELNDDMTKAHIIGATTYDPSAQDEYDNLDPYTYGLEPYRLDELGYVEPHQIEAWIEKVLRPGTRISTPGEFDMDAVLAVVQLARRTRRKGGDFIGWVSNELNLPADLDAWSIVENSFTDDALDYLYAIDTLIEEGYQWWQAISHANAKIKEASQ